MRAGIAAKPVSIAASGCPRVDEAALEGAAMHVLVARVSPIVGVSHTIIRLPVHYAARPAAGRDVVQDPLGEVASRFVRRKASYNGLLRAVIRLRRWPPLLSISGYAVTLAPGPAEFVRLDLAGWAYPPNSHERLKKFEYIVNKLQHGSYFGNKNT